MTLLVLGVGQVVVSALGVVWLSQTHLLGRRIILLHVTIVALLFATIFIAFVQSLRLRIVRDSRAARRLILLVPGFASMLLGFLYIGDYASQFWGRNLNYVLVLEHLRSLVRNGSGLVPIGGVLYVALAAYLCVFMGVYQLAGRRLWSGAEHIRLLTTTEPRRYGRWCQAAVCVVLLGWVGTLGYLAWTWNRPGSYLVPRYEPITSFFVSRFPDPPVASPRTAFVPSQPSPASLPAAHEPRNVVLITIDSARADHLQPYGYQRLTSPFLNGLSTGGALRKIDMALATCPESQCAIRSTLEAVPFDGFAQHNVRLQDVLHDAGYQAYFLLSGIHNWYGLREAYAGVDFVFDGTNSRRYLAADDRILFEGLERVPRYSGTPSFFFFHLMSAHGVGVRQPASRRFTTSEQDWLGFILEAPDRELYANNYDDGLVQADAVIGELFDWLQRMGYLERSIVVVLGDHGEALGERPPDYSLGHITGLYQEFLHIPLLIHDPGVHTYQRSFAAQIDVAPTIVDRLGLPIPSSWEGQSLLQPEPPVRYTFHQTVGAAPIRLVVRRTSTSIHKYMRTNQGEELYDIVSDPGERKNLLPHAPESLLTELRAAMEARVPDSR